MKLIRKSTSEAVSLEDGFLWADEFEWKPIEQKLERAIDGTAIIQEGKKKSGRPINLQPADIAKFLIIYHNRSYGILNRF